MRRKEGRISILRSAIASTSHLKISVEFFNKKVWIQRNYLVNILRFLHIFGESGLLCGIFKGAKLRGSTKEVCNVCTALHTCNSLRYMPFGRARDLDMYDICATECQIFVKYGINMLKKILIWRYSKLSDYI